MFVKYVTFLEWFRDFLFFDWFPSSSEKWKFLNDAFRLRIHRQSSPWIRLSRNVLHKNIRAFLSSDFSAISETKTSSKIFTNTNLVQTTHAPNQTKSRLYWRTNYVANLKITLTSSNRFCLNPPQTLDLSRFNVLAKFSKIRRKFLSSFF
jgi:hypothetical protein